jgi:hypothetical protein
MLILYILLVLSFLALVWAAVAMTRHIRRNHSAQPLQDPHETTRPGRTA